MWVAIAANQIVEKTIVSVIKMDESVQKLASVLVVKILIHQPIQMNYL